MAQTILLPIQFSFMSRPAKWAKGSVRLGVVKFGRFPMVEVTILSPKEFLGVRQLVWPERLPLGVREQLGPIKHLKFKTNRVEIDVLLCSPDRMASNIDPWQARADFLSIKQSTDELLKFLNRYGVWSNRSSVVFCSMETPCPQIIFEEEIWADRDYVLEVLKVGPAQWFEGDKGSLEHLIPRREYPHYEHKDGFCLDAMTTATTIDFLRRVRFKICARRDCGNPFPADRKGKRYCQQYCAHLVSVRKGRKAKRTRKEEQQ